MSRTISNPVREALLMAALFGSVGIASAQTPPSNAGDLQSAQSPKVPGQAGVEEPTAKQAPQAAGPGIFADGRLNVPNAPENTATTPAKFSPQNDRLDQTPLLARGPQLSDAQRRLILDAVRSEGVAAAPAGPVGPASQLPADVAMQPWPANVVSEIPDLRDTKYVTLAESILVVRPENRIVIGEIKR